VVPRMSQPDTMTGTRGSRVTTRGAVTEPASEPTPYPAIPAATSCPGCPVSTPRIASPSANPNQQNQPTPAITMPSATTRCSRRTCRAGRWTDCPVGWDCAYRRTGSTIAAASATARASNHISGIAPCWVTTQAATGGLATMLIRCAKSCQASARTATPGPRRSPMSARIARVAGFPTAAAAPVTSPLTHRCHTVSASKAAPTATIRCPSACTPSTAASERPEVSR
jgi:hypothetical protein